MKDNCKSAGYEARCVSYKVRYDNRTEDPDPKYDDCGVTDRNPEGPVKRQTTIILDLDVTTCDLEDPDETANVDDSNKVTIPDGTDDKNKTDTTGDKEG
ncbi:MAG: hypothetical protein ACRDTH_22620 [Pseudonocardiaceae bacterium]